MTQDFEYGVDSRYKNNKERESDSIALMQARLERMKSLSHEQIIKAKLLQLKLKMERFLNEPESDNHNPFSSFLEMYIDAIYTQRSSFAKDINVSPVFLSQVINNHRKPKEEFILKLMIHPELVFKGVCNFHNEIWYQVYFQEKISETMSSQDEWRPTIEKQVKISKLFDK